MTQRLHRRLLARWLGPAAVVLGVLVFVVNEAGYRATQSLGAQREAALRAHQQVVQIRSLVAQAEAAQRGYVLTGRSDYLGPYNGTQQELARSLDAARDLASRQPDQGETLSRLVELTERRISEMQEVMRLHGDGGPAAAIELMLTDIGREHMSAIDDLAGLVSVVEAEALQRAERLQARVQAASRAGVALLLAASLLAVWLTLRLVRQRDDDRRAHLRELTAERDKLEHEVDRRTEELDELARHLQSVREDERAHLARELHDELGGLLTAAKLDLARLRKRTAGAGDDVAERLAQLGRSLDAGIALKRRIIEDLRPSSLDHLGLQHALEIQCAEFAQRGELRLRAEIEDVALSPQRALVAYRLLQEALTNVAKHARASEVVVQLTRDGDRARLRVVDDGQGFDSTQRTPGAHGLAGMRFRVRSCGGRFSVRSAPGQGTTLEALLPI